MGRHVLNDFVTLKVCPALASHIRVRQVLLLRIKFCDMKACVRIHVCVAVPPQLLLTVKVPIKISAVYIKV